MHGAVALVVLLTELGWEQYGLCFVVVERLLRNEKRGWEAILAQSEEYFGLVGWWAEQNQLRLH